jgi:hypothetical protein
MSMPGDQPKPFRQFVSTWRREIIRGGVLFGLVVVGGVMISNAVRAGLNVPWAALRSFGDFDIDHDGDLFGPGREVGDQWQWTGSVKPSQQVWIRNTNGPVEVVQGTGDQLQVTTEKSWRNSQPSAVELVPVESERGVTICALWTARDRRCGAAGEYHMSHVRKNDVAVRFTVHLPRGVKIDVSTVNGQVAIDGAAAPVVAATVNGRVVVHTSVGPVTASTVNGSIEATMDALTGGDIELQTVNGTVTAILPRSLNAIVDAQTVNGRVDTDFPLQITGKISPRHVRGTIGTGGLTLKLNTVNGSVMIRRPDANTPKPAVAPVAPRRSRTRPEARVTVTPAPDPVPPPRP